MGGGNAGRPRKRGIAATVAAEIGGEVERLTGVGPVDGIDFEAVETAARRLALEVVGKALAARPDADRSDEKGARPCACGARARHAGRRPKTFTTALGEMELTRAWYHCDDCGAGFAPRDRELGLEGTAPFAARALREARCRCFQAAPRRVVLGDGAPWIWKWADEHAPGAIQIVDIRRAKEHLCEVAKAIFGAGADLADQWGKQRRDELDRGRIDDILAALRAHADSCDDARRCVAHIDNNRHRMRYPKFRAMGPCVATGVVEGACKNVVGSRLKRGGMHWTVDGANAILALRCAILGNRFDDFWERRACAH